MLKKLDYIYRYYLGYRYKVPSSYSLSFAYYMILSIIPICTIIAFLIPFFPLDTIIAEEILANYLNKDLLEIIISLLKPKSLSFTTLSTLIVSIFVISRGFYQIQNVSKNMFPIDKEYPFIIELIINFFKTILIFILLLAVISLIIIIPFLKLIFIEKHSFITQILFLFIIIFIILFLLYKILLNQNIHIKDIIKGTVLATTLIEIVIGILAIYFSIVDYTNVYGPFAALVMFMFSIAVCSEFIFLGMYIIFECHMKRIMEKL